VLLLFQINENNILNIYFSFSKRCAIQLDFDYCNDVKGLLSDYMLFFYSRIADSSYFSSKFIFKKLRTGSLCANYQFK
jgi:hypothetical protein